MGFTIKGTLHKVGETQVVSDRFSKREFIISFADNPRYPQYAKLEASGGRCAMLDDFAPGDEVEVEFQVRGRLYTSKKTDEEDCFTSLSAWKVTAIGERKSAPRPPATAPNGGGSYGSTPDDDGIPFASCAITHDPSPIARVLR